MKKALTLILAAATLVALYSVPVFAETPDAASVRAALQQLDSAPTIDGNDVLVPVGLVQTIKAWDDSGKKYDSAKPVFACSDQNGWLVRGGAYGSDLRLRATTMVREGNFFRAVEMKGKRFHPCQTDTPAAANDPIKGVRWADVAGYVSGDYTKTAWIDTSEGKDKPCLLVK